MKSAARGFGPAPALRSGEWTTTKAIGPMARRASLPERSAPRRRRCSSLTRSYGDSALNQAVKFGAVSP